MALAFVVTLEKDLSQPPEAVKGASGKAVARESDKLDYAARCKNVEPMTALLSESQARLIEQLKADGFDPSRMRLPPEQWYPASNGLRTVRALIEYVSEKLNDFKQPNPILRDLRMVPVPACFDKLRRAGLVLRSQEDGIAAYGDEQAVERLRLHIAAAGRPLGMAFQVFFTDPHFFEYTAPAWPRGKLLFLDTADSVTDESGRRIVHATPFVEASAFLERDHARLACILGERVLAPTPAMVEAVSLLARNEGILLDPVYSGKGMAGLIDLVRQGRFAKGEKVLFVHTGGSVGLFGYPGEFDGVLAPARDRR